jgi:tRNA pseudouridine55 synthase
VLPVYFGRAARLVGAPVDRRKRYEAEILLGAGSSTDDREGIITPVALPDDVSAARVQQELLGFLGEIMQQPPAYSAVHVEGRRSYQRARASALSGVAPALPHARSVVLYDAALVDLERRDERAVARVELECGPGFYVRALSRDLGLALGTQAHLAALQRSRDGAFHLRDAISLEQAESRGADIETALLPPASALQSLTAVPVAEDYIGELRLGRTAPAEGFPDGSAWARDLNERVLALGQVREQRFWPHRLVEI